METFPFVRYSIRKFHFFFVFSNKLFSITFHFHMRFTNLTTQLGGWLVRAAIHYSCGCVRVYATTTIAKRNVYKRLKKSGLGTKNCCFLLEQQLTQKLLQLWTISSRDTCTQFFYVLIQQSSIRVVFVIYKMCLVFICIF